MKEIEDTPYFYEGSQDSTLESIAKRVTELRQSGRLTPEVLHTIRKYFRIKNIYHSNAIEGNTLNVGETRQVVELGLTITGKPLKDQAEAKNLAEATDFLEDLVSNPTAPISLADIREIHYLVLKGINDTEAGKFRSVAVEISGSQFKPPGPESVGPQIEDFGRWLAAGSTPGDKFASLHGILAAAIAHTWLAYIHPFIDGNGRVARLLMNLILMRYGIPIAIITREDRLRYYDALEQSQSCDLSGFIGLLCECIHESLEEYEEAAKEQREREEWARSIAERLGASAEARARSQYEVWKSAQELLRSYMKQTATLIDQSNPFGRVYFRDFGILEFEKYANLSLGGSAKKTWYFRIDFRSGDKSDRYLFFFGYPSYQLRSKCDVTLHAAREVPPNSYNYERLDNLSFAEVPNLVEVGYEATKEQFIAKYHDDTVHAGKIERLGREFFEQVIKKQFSR